MEGLPVEMCKNEVWPCSAPKGWGRTPRALSWSLGGAPCVCSTDHQLTEAAHGPLPGRCNPAGSGRKRSPWCFPDAMEADGGSGHTGPRSVGVTEEVTGEGVAQQHACVPCHMGPLHPGSFCPSSRIGAALIPLLVIAPHSTLGLLREFSQHSIVHIPWNTSDIHSPKDFTPIP